MNAHANISFFFSLHYLDWDELEEKARKGKVNLFPLAIYFLKRFADP